MEDWFLLLIFAAEVLNNMNTAVRRALFFFLLLTPIFTSCVDEPFVENATEDCITIKVETTKSNINQDGDIDSSVESLRVLAFKQGLCVSNVRHEIIGETGKINHYIDKGTYTFVFIANEPETSAADLAAIRTYGQLETMAFPSSAFNAADPIPMIQTKEEVTVVAGGNEGDPLEVGLDRMGVRLDFVLKFEKDLSGLFKGINITNLPDRVPLFPDTYTGTLDRGESYTYSYATDPSFFEEIEATETGVAWAIKVPRIIIPSNTLAKDEWDDEDKAVGFTILLESPNEDRTALLNPQEPDDLGYSLPMNIGLRVTGYVSESLQLNIEASEWSTYSANWEIEVGKELNVSHTSVNLTDYNGARISFQSNMPKVQVLTTVTKDGSSMATDNAFNDLTNPALTDGVYSTTRFSYDTSTGEGYMDLLADGVFSTSTPSVTPAFSGTYVLTLSAEDTDGTTLQRKITVVVNQTGNRFYFDPEYFGYVGSFFRNDETGERVISGQHSGAWSAEVESGEDWIILSSTPSMDPAIGTDDPGDPEHYPVIPNKYKGEDGTKVSGKGRIYFRVGIADENSGTNPEPRYGVIKLTHFRYGSSNTYYHYVRQGQKDDYIMRPEDAMTVTDPDGATASYSARSAARKFSPYNLTSQAFKDDLTYSGGYADVAPGGGVFVDYPSQAGGFFQWGILPTIARAGAAFAPVVGSSDIEYDWYGFRAGYVEALIWYNDNGRWYSGYRYWSNDLSSSLETCPAGYKRPNDGSTTALSYNRTHSEIIQSEWRVSLFRSPKGGDWSTNANDNPNPEAGRPGVYPAENLSEMIFGFYADGFFDRRPILIGKQFSATASNEDRYASSYYAVAPNTTGIAFRGNLFFNETTKASVFFPGAGRRHNERGRFQYRNKGYYLTSSVANGYSNPSGSSNIYNNIWTMELGALGTSTYPISALQTFGMSLRCIVDD